jgi:hypothetical protein
MQSVPITLTLRVRIPLRRGVLDTTLCDKMCQRLAAGRWFSPVSSTNKTDCHDIIEILLNVAITLSLTNACLPDFYDIYEKIVFRMAGHVGWMTSDHISWNYPDKIALLNNIILKHMDKPNVFGCILYILLRSFGFPAANHLNYLAFQPFDC